MTTTVSGPTLALQTWGRRVSALSAVDSSGPVATPDVDCHLSWYGPARVAPDRPGSEAAVQALSGLMHVHGRDEGRPRRIGLDLASTAAGVLASQGVLAALISRCRERPVSAVETSVVQAGLLLVSHYVAIASSPGDGPSVATWPSPGPPFRSADGQWFEMETLDPDAWRAFWSTLGAAGTDLGPAWTVFRLRYNRGACSLPQVLHDSTARHTLAEVTEVADACGVSVSRLRSYAEILADPAWSEMHPAIGPLGAPFHAPDEAGPESPTTSPRGEAPIHLPLEGLRVIEATNRVQGPLAGLLLGMLGADVVLVEPPGGDPSRAGVPKAGDTGAFFVCFNRGKRSVELDLRRAPGRSALLELAADADVFLHNWRPGKAVEWGLDADDLARVNSRLVYAAASAWGEVSGPSQLVGTDFMVQAYAGVGNGINPVDEPPFPSRLLVSDYMGGLLACEGALAGLYRRERTGRGCRVRSSLLGGAMTAQAPVLEAMAADGEIRRREGRPLWGRLDRPLDTVDGNVVVSVDDDSALVRLGRAFGVSVDGNDRAATEQRLVERMAAQPATRCEELAAAADVPCSVACTDLGSLPGDPRLAALFEPLGGGSLAPGSPWRFT